MLVVSMFDGNGDKTLLYEQKEYRKVYAQHDYVYNKNVLIMCSFIISVITDISGNMMHI